MATGTGGGGAAAQTGNDSTPTKSTKKRLIRTLPFLRRATSHARAGEVQKTPQTKVGPPVLLREVGF